MTTIELSREELDYGFVATDASNHKVKMDTSPESGGNNFGARPMQMLLMALAGCSAIDVIGILNKQRQTITDYKMKVQGEREAGKEPSLWKTIEVEFHLWGNIDETKAQRAADLSIQKYCSVAATLRAAGAEICWTVIVNKEVKEIV
ncbi:MAG: OsmC family protein [Bacteroidota bacterium]|nr:OsmC family protein [Bacteroidota bacterium]